MMAVLVEGLSVVVRNDALLRKFHGGPRRFQEGLQDEAICFDNDLTCIHLRSPDEVERFIGWCESMGLTFATRGQAADIVVLDQRQGPTLPCTWIASSVLKIDDGENKCRACICWLADEAPPASGTRVPSMRFEIQTPVGWRVKGSLSESHVFVPNLR